MVKYKEYIQKMLVENKQVFDKFRQIHDQYALHPNAWRNKFNREGKKVVDIIREYEDKLCSGSERGKFSKYSANLAQKFQEEVKHQFPKIDHVGVIVINQTSSIDLSNLKKLSPLK